MSVESEIQQIPFKYKVSAATKVTLTEDSVLTGKVMNAVAHFPDGCDALVEIILYVGQKQIFPSWDVLALNDTTQKFRIEKSVRKGEAIRAILDNGDGFNPHTPSLIVEVEGVA